MKRRDLSSFDASHRAGNELETVLRRVAEAAALFEPQVGASDATREPRIFTHEARRNVTRVLFISQETDLLNPETQSLDGLIKLSDLFDEVHILILREGITPKDPVLRVSDNVWLYTASSRVWWRLPQAGIDMVEAQLVFASGFRPDLIIARDAFESALVAKAIAEKYHKPTQLHILEDFIGWQALRKLPHYRLRRFIPRRTVKHFLSIRTGTHFLQDKITKKYQPVEIATLPRFHDYSAVMESKAAVDLQQIYQPFIFVILYIGKLSHESLLFRAIDGARFALQNPRVGMVVLGDGPAHNEFKNRTKILQIEKQVVFEKRPVDRLSYLKSANLLIVSDVDVASDELVKEAAAAGIPMVMAKTSLREDLFVHNESAWLCDKDDTQAFTDGVNELLNNFALRREFSELTKLMIQEKFHQNPYHYQEEYRTSLEQAIFVEPPATPE
jgi:glycosyltransferase involved in cell wall biosynthesis